MIHLFSLCFPKLNCESNSSSIADKSFVEHDDHPSLQKGDSPNTPVTPTGGDKGETSSQRANHHDLPPPEPEESSSSSDDDDF